MASGKINSIQLTETGSMPQNKTNKLVDKLSMSGSSWKTKQDVWMLVVWGSVYCMHVKIWIREC